MSDNDSTKRGGEAIIGTIAVTTGAKIGMEAGSMVVRKAAGLVITGSVPVWVWMATNPVGQAVLLGGGATVGAICAYKAVKKLL